MESLTTPDVSASSDASILVETTPPTAFTYTSSTTAMQTGVAYYPPNGTAQSGYSGAMPGQKAGVAVGTIGMF
jgi:hypothetical protein